MGDGRWEYWGGSAKRAKSRVPLNGVHHSPVMVETSEVYWDTILGMLRNNPDPVDASLQVAWSKAGYGGVRDSKRGHTHYWM